MVMKSLCGWTCVCVAACLIALHWHFSEQNENLQETKWLWITKKKVNKQINNEKQRTPQRCVVGLLTCDKTNTNEAIWPERQVNEECWLKRRAECRIKGLSCSLWAMLCADSCFNKTLRGGSGYQVDSDKEPHNEKGKRPAGGLAYIHAQTHTYQTHQTCACVWTTRSKHREEQVACHRLVPNGIGRPVQGTVIKPTQSPIAKTGHGTKEAMKGGGTDPTITHWSQTAGFCWGLDLALCGSTTLPARLPYYPATRVTVYEENGATYFLFMRVLPVPVDKYLQWVAVRSVFVSRLPNHAQHVNTHLIISSWAFGLMRSHWTWVGPTPTAWHSSAYSDVRERRENRKREQLEKKTNLYRSKNAAQFLLTHPLHFASGS